MKKLLIFLLIGIFSLIFSLYLGCKKYESPKNLGLNRSPKEGYRKPLQSREETASQYKGEQNKGEQTINKGEDPLRKWQVKSAEACQKQFQSCVKKCDDMACEGVCLKLLSACERNLPIEVQTLKER